MLKQSHQRSCKQARPEQPEQQGTADADVQGKGGLPTLSKACTDFFPTLRVLSFAKEVLASSLTDILVWSLNAHMFGKDQQSALCTWQQWMQALHCRHTREPF